MIGVSQMLAKDEIPMIGNLPTPGKSWVFIFYDLQYEKIDRSGIV